VKSIHGLVRICGKGERASGNLFVRKEVLEKIR